MAYRDHEWGGLEYCGGHHSFLSGSVGHAGTGASHHWYYAIASKKLWGTGIPSHNPAVKVVELWAKVPDGYGEDSDGSSDSDTDSDEDGEPPKQWCPDDPALAKALAKRLGLAIGGKGYGFEGNYGNKGPCLLSAPAWYMLQSRFKPRR